MHSSSDKILFASLSLLIFFMSCLLLSFLFPLFFPLLFLAIFILGYSRFSGSEIPS